MRLIEAEKAKDVIHEYFKSLMVNGASGTDVDRLAVGIGSCLKHDANLLKAIDELPLAEPDTTTHDSIPAETSGNGEDRTSGDCISRQQAIDALKELTANGTNKGMVFGEDAVHRIEILPSAQPDIICCKDCKFYTAYDYTGKLMCKRIGKGMILPKPEDYCSYAERITDGRPN